MGLIHIGSVRVSSALGLLSVGLLAAGCGINGQATSPPASSAARPPPSSIALTSTTERPHVPAAPILLTVTAALTTTEVAEGWDNCISTMDLTDNQGATSYGGTEDCVDSSLVAEDGGVELEPVSPAPGHWIGGNQGWVARLPGSDSFVSILAAGWSGVITCEIQVHGQKPIIETDNAMTGPVVDCEYGTGSPSSAGG